MRCFVFSGLRLRQTRRNSCPSSHKPSGFSQNAAIFTFSIFQRCKFESSRYGVSSTIQISSKFKFNPHPYLHPRERRGEVRHEARERAAVPARGRRVRRSAAARGDCPGGSLPADVRPAAFLLASRFASLFKTFENVVTSGKAQRR